VKEVTCICGERVVFLDPEVETKTCPNCGMPVRQYALPPEEAAPETKKRRKRRPSRIGPKALVFAGAISLLLAVAGLLVGLSVAKRSALSRAVVAVRDAEAAETRGDFNAAAANYQRAIRNYRAWSASQDIIKPLETALARVESNIADAAAAARQTVGDDELLSISLEEIARQAYMGSPEAFQPIFEREYARRIVILQGRVEQGVGRAYKASALTISYKVFSPTGDEVELSFNGPFFERYRLKQGAECVVRGVLAQMYRDPGGPGQAGRWVIVFDGAKSSLVTDVAQLKGLGWKVDDEIGNLVASQRVLSPAY
jgi:hypothetical protein